MGFLKPKTPKVVSAQDSSANTAPPAANPAQQADYAASETSSIARAPGSLISTSSQGLTRKARTQKPSLIGSTSSAN